MAELAADYPAPLLQSVSIIDENYCFPYSVPLSVQGKGVFQTNVDISGVNGVVHFVLKSVLVFMTLFERALRKSLHLSSFFLVHVSFLLS